VRPDLLEDAVRRGLLAGLVFGLFMYAVGSSHSVGNAVLAGLLFAVFYGPIVVGHEWRRWPGGRSLPPRERRAVVRAVRRGKTIEDPRLAQAVIEYALAVGARWEQEFWAGWSLLLCACAGQVAFAIAETKAGAIRAAIAWWVLAALSLASAAVAPRQRRHAIEHAEQAGAAARRLQDAS
jgi:hypothetical protein